MRRVHLDNSASVRLEKLDVRMKNAVGALPESIFVNVGDVVEVDHDAGFLRGHGTQVVEGNLMATVCGTVERVNKLISVRPLKSRYMAETGDVLVGRILQVVPKRWKVDVNGRQHAALMLSAVNLPGGIQRRRTADDELNMRLFFEENDVISAEVQSFHQDGSMSLHTRSDKYGKLENGQLVTVAPYLVKRLKQHFQVLKPCEVAVILGVNGYVWVSLPLQQPEPNAVQPFGMDVIDERDASPAVGEESIIGKAKPGSVSREMRERICRVANALRVLNELGLMIYPESILDVYEASVTWNVEVRDMLRPEFMLRYAESDMLRREDTSRY